MPETELVDLVDEDNRIVGTVTRAAMRAAQAPHRACYIAFADQRDRFLVEVRTLAKDYAPGLFDACVGGVLQHGEDPHAGAARELFEEIGVDAGRILFEFLGTRRISWSGGRRFLYAYLYFARGDALTVRQPSEVSGVMYLRPSELRPLYPSCARDSVEAFEAILNKAAGRGLYRPEVCLREAKAL